MTTARPDDAQIRAFAEREKANTLAYLGIEYDSYRDKVLAFALTEPKNYAKLKSDVKSILLKNILSDLHDTIYYALYLGTQKNGTTSLFVDTILNDERPQVPVKEIEDTALSVSESLKILLNKVVDKLLPRVFDDYAKGKLNRIGKAGLIPKEEEK